METGLKKKAVMQYLHYFRFWFIAIGILAVLFAILKVKSPVNHKAPQERVYDYADVLTDGEEAMLRQYIAEKEAVLHIHIVLVTFSLPVEGQEAKEQYGYRYTDWERNMQELADAFWDGHKYGYNRSFEGDGVVLIHNWYPGQNGEHLSTSGKVEWRFGDDEIENVLNAVDAYYETDPYRAYRAYVDEICNMFDSHGGGDIPWAVVLLISSVTALIYAGVHLFQKKAKNTTAANAYVVGGKPVLRDSGDDFLRKRVTSRRVDTSSSGGHHRSRSGARHGGGSHRH